MEMDNRECANCNAMFRVLKSSNTKTCSQNCLREFSGEHKGFGQWKPKQKESGDVSAIKKNMPTILSSGPPKELETKSKEWAQTEKNISKQQSEDIKSKKKSSIESELKELKMIQTEKESNESGMQKTDLKLPEKREIAGDGETQLEGSMQPYKNLDLEKSLKTNYLDSSIERLHKLAMRLNPHLDNEERAILPDEVQTTVKVFSEMRCLMKTKLDIAKFIKELR